MILRTLAGLVLALTATTTAHAAHRPSYPPLPPPAATAAEPTPDGVVVTLADWRGDSMVRVAWRLLAQGRLAAQPTGSVDTRVDGDGRGRVLLPLTIPGTYRVSATGIAQDGEPTVITMTVEVPCRCATATPGHAPGRSLAATGFAWLGWLLAGLLLIVAGLLMRGSDRRR